MSQLVWHASSAISLDESVASVDPYDLKSVWELGRATLRLAKAERVEIDRDLCTKVCSPEANISAVMFRAAILNILAERVGLLPPELPKVHEAVFNVAARIPVKKQMEPGDQFPFDLQELVKEIESELRRLGYELPEPLA
jgi:hypothetical protein